MGHNKLSSEHDGPIPRLALDQIVKPITDAPPKSHDTGMTPREPAATQMPMRDANPSPTQAPSKPPHDEATDAIAEGFGLPDSARGAVRPPSEAPSDAFTDMPRPMSAGKTDQEPSHLKPTVSTLYEKILAQQQTSGAVRRRSSASGSRAGERPAKGHEPTRQMGVPDPSDWQRGPPTPSGGTSDNAMHAKGVPDPADWQRGLPPPHAGAMDGAMHAKGVPDPSDWQRGVVPIMEGVGQGVSHAKGMPDPADWHRQGPVVGEIPHLHQDQGGLGSEQHAGDDAEGPPDHEAPNAGASGNDEAHGNGQEAAPAAAKKPQRYSYLQQIGVIGKGPPPQAGEHWGRQQLRASPRRPSLPGDPGEASSRPQPPTIRSAACDAV